MGDEKCPEIKLTTFGVSNWAGLGLQTPRKVSMKSQDLEDISFTSAVLPDPQQHFLAGSSLQVGGQEAGDSGRSPAGRGKQPG